jgi:hypothetical protein
MVDPELDSSIRRVEGRLSGPELSLSAAKC